MHLHYPIALRLQGQPCLVVGGGQVAYRKALTLIDCGGMVRLVSPKLVPELAELVEADKVELAQREFQEKDLEDIFLVIGATDDREVNSRIGELARSHNLLTNIVDQPLDCNFIIPAIHRVGSLCMGVTTDGKSPALAGRIRRQLGETYREAYGIGLDWLGEIRTFLLSNETDPARRRELLITLGGFRLVELLEVSQVQEALDWICQLLTGLSGVDRLMDDLRLIYDEWIEMRDCVEENTDR